MQIKPRPGKGGVNAVVTEGLSGQSVLTDVHKRRLADGYAVGGCSSLAPQWRAGRPGTRRLLPSGVPHPEDSKAATLLDLDSEWQAAPLESGLHALEALVDGPLSDA